MKAEFSNALSDAMNNAEKVVNDMKEAYKPEIDMLSGNFQALQDEMDKCEDEAARQKSLLPDRTDV